MEARGVPSPPLPPANTPVADNWCFTHVDVVKSSYMWTIDDFTSQCRSEEDVVLKSSIFPTGAREKFKWCLRIHPKGLDEESKDYISLYLICISCDHSETRVKLVCSIINSERVVTHRKEFRTEFTYVKGKDWGFKDYIRRDFLLNEANGLLSDNKLTIYCEVSAAGDSANISGQNDVVKFKIPQCKLAEDFGQLLVNEKFCDVTLVAEYSREFRAHRAVLSVRSDVFAVMFQHDDMRHNRVFITDVDANVLKEMLHFIYTGAAPNITGMAGDLLAAAEKYALERLKVMCEEALCVQLTIRTAAETLILADIHSAKQLKAQTLNFIRCHATAIMETQGWQIMTAEHANLVAEVYRELATQLIPTNRLLPQ